MARVKYKSRRLLPPFQEFVSNGPYLHAKENRHYITYYELGNSDENKHTISYARYLMSIKLGRLLDQNSEQVDHIDDDCTYDVYSNLQILTYSQNRDKSTKVGRNRKTYYEVICVGCNKKFTVPEWKVKSKDIISCSRSCSGAVSTMIQYESKTRDEVIALNIKNKIEDSKIEIQNKYIIEDFNLYSSEINVDDRNVIKNANIYNDHYKKCGNIKQINDYRYIYVPTHPNADNDGYLPEHVYKNEKNTGCYLKTNQTVVHLDGNTINNESDNLAVVYGNSNYFSIYGKGKCDKSYIPRECKHCRIHLDNNHNYCSPDCYAIASKKNRPSKEELINLLENNSFTALGKLFCVSGNAVKKWCKSYDIDYKGILDNKKYKPVEKMCKFCGNSFLPKDLTRENSQMFCSTKCTGSAWRQKQLQNLNK
jgi:hypothetical protein